MSVPGQTRKSDRPHGMSALPPAADIGSLHAQVRFVPTTEVVARQTGIHRQGGHLYAAGGAERAATR